MSTVDSSAATSPQAALQNRLNDPDVIAGLNRLLDHLDIITMAVESMDEFIGRGDTIADNVADMVSDLKQAENAPAMELIRKTPRMLKTGSELADAAETMDVDALTRSQVLERLTDPETLETLNGLLDRLPLAAFLLQSLDELLHRGDTIADNMADMVHDLKLGQTEQKLALLKQLFDALPKLRAASEALLESDLLGDQLPTVLDAGVAMVESGMMDREILGVLGELGKKSVETYQEVASRPIQPVGGLWATLKATKDPDVQKTVGFFFAFAKAFAKHLK